MDSRNKNPAQQETPRNKKPRATRNPAQQETPRKSLHDNAGHVQTQVERPVRNPLRNDPLFCK